MREAEEFMEKKIIRAIVALGMGLLLTLTVSGAALAQETQVSGTVTSITGERLPGVTVQVRGTTTTTTTDANGKYTITSPPDGVLLFALIGYKGAARTIASRPQIDVALESAVAVLEPVIVTGYTAQARNSITGSVSSINVEGAQQQTSTSVLQRLDGRVPGVTVEAGGAPGSRSTVRIRGVTRFQRGGARVNTTFNMGRATIGQNISISREQHHGAEGLIDDNVGEGGIVGKNIFMQPVVPVYDVGGNFASGKSNTLGNQSNPAKINYYARNNIATNDRMFGNVFGSIDAGHALSLKSKFGFNLLQGSYHGYTPATPEDHEPTNIDGINENYSGFTELTITNTLNYSRTMNQHNLTVLLGQEAIKANFRFEAGNCASLRKNDVNSRYIDDALCDPNSKNVSSSGSKRALLSFFGKADYNYGERYYLSVTMRRDGSSTFGPTNRWATFPAVGAGWRLSRESFFQSLPVQNLMLRFGWGVTGNQNIPFRIYDTYGGGRGDTFYDIGGTGSSIQPGFKTSALGNTTLKWEENHSTNVGLDFEFLNSRGNFTVDLYRRNTRNLLFDPPQPAAGGSAASPILNIGSMSNNGIDFSVGYHSTIGTRTVWSVTFNGSHYNNKITNIDGVQTSFFGRGSSVVREQNAMHNELGHPLGSFYGLIAEGYYVDSLDAALQWKQGARPGRMKFRDLDGDNQITAADRTFIGSPHPKFTGGLDLAVRRGNWELSGTVFGSFGGKIFNTQRYWYAFRYFQKNVAKDMLTNSAQLNGDCEPIPPPGPGLPSPGYRCPGRLTNPDAKYPRLDNSDDWSRQFSSYWVESGSYVRLRTLQLSYNLPPAIVRWIPAARIYLQAENLFTLSGYSGLDPSLPVPAAGTNDGRDIRDESRGIDQGVYPSNKIITIGISTTF